MQSFLHKIDVMVFCQEILVVDCHHHRITSALFIRSLLQQGYKKEDGVHDTIYNDDCDENDPCDKSLKNLHRYFY